MLSRLCLLLFSFATFADAATFEFKKGDRVVFVGNTFAERMVRYGHFEALLHAKLPEHQLVVRNLGWSGDEIWAGNAKPGGNAWSVDPVSTQLRPLNFGDQQTHLTEQKADVIIACYGMNESFAGPEKLPKFETDLAAWIDFQKSQNYSGKGAPRIILVSPIPHEHLPQLGLDPSPHNKNIEAYTSVMHKVAEAKKVTFINLLQSIEMTGGMATIQRTINGIHLTQSGNQLVATQMMQQLGLGDSGKPSAELSKATGDKNLWFFYRYHALNGEYIYGRRKEPFGVISFPPEMSAMDELINKKDQAIWDLVKPKPEPKKE